MERGLVIYRNKLHRLIHHSHDCSMSLNIEQRRLLSHLFRLLIRSVSLLTGLLTWRILYSSQAVKSTRFVLGRFCLPLLTRIKLHLLSRVGPCSLAAVTSSSPSSSSSSSTSSTATSKLCGFSISHCEYSGVRFSVITILARLISRPDE